MARTTNAQAGWLALGVFLLSTISGTGTAFAQVSPGAVQFGNSIYIANTNSGTLQVTVNRVGGSVGQAVVSYSTYNESAAAGTDYVATSGSLIWNDGDATSRIISVPILPGGTGGRAFALDLLSASGVQFGATVQANAYISPVAPTAVTAVVGAQPAAVAGAVQFASPIYYTNSNAASMQVTVQRVGGGTGPATVTYSTADETAVAGIDYSASTGTLSWADGDMTSRTITVPILATGPGGRMFAMELLTAEGAQFGNPILSNVFIFPGGAGPVSTPAGLSISVSGNQLVDGGGHIIQLRGANMSGLEDGTSFGAQHPWDNSNLTNGAGSYPNFSALATWKLNAIRLPISEGAWLGLTVTNPNGTTQSLDPSGDYQSTVINSVTQLNALGIYVILDLHGAAPGNFNEDAQNPFMDADHSVTFWTQVAAAFKGNPGVLFEAFNEPFLFDTSHCCNGVFPVGSNFNQAIRDGGLPANQFAIDNYSPGNYAQDEFLPYNWTIVGYQAIINAIRSTGASNVIILGGQNYSSDLTWWTQYPPSDPLHQLALAYHGYPTSWGYDITGESRQYTAAQTIAMLSAPNVPVIITEMGGPVGPGASTWFVNTMLAVIDAQGWSVTAWTWNPWNGGNVGANTLIQDIVNYTPTVGLGQVYYGWAANHP